MLDGIWWTERVNHQSVHTHYDPWWWTNMSWDQSLPVCNKHHDIIRTRGQLQAHHILLKITQQHWMKLSDAQSQAVHYHASTKRMVALLSRLNIQNMDRSRKPTVLYDQVRLKPKTSPMGPRTHRVQLCTQIQERVHNDPSRCLIKTTRPPGGDGTQQQRTNTPSPKLFKEQLKANQLWFEHKCEASILHTWALAGWTIGTLRAIFVEDVKKSTADLNKKVKKGLKEAQGNQEWLVLETTWWPYPKGWVNCSSERLGTQMKDYISLPWYNHV